MDIFSTNEKQVKTQLCLAQFHLKFNNKKKVVADEAAEILEMNKNAIKILSKSFNIDPILITQKKLLDYVSISFINGNNSRISLICKAKNIMAEDGIIFELIPPHDKEIILPNGKKILLQNAALKKMAGIKKAKHTKTTAEREKEKENECN